MEYKDYLIRNARAKEMFSKMLGLSKRHIQECIYEFIDTAKLNGVMSAEILVNAASDKNSYAHSIFDWNSTPEERLARAEYILSELTFLIDKDGNIYNIVVK